MTPRTLVATTLALSMLCSGASFAQGHGNNGDRGNNDRGRQEQSERGGHPNQAGRQQQAAPRMEQPWQPGRSAPGARNDERGAGPERDFHRGGRLPQQYRGNQYVVDDWRGHHLSAPPRGYHWVQTGGDYVLVAIATGIILQLLLNN
jgi:Ni/Co efflux regulator RcnB